jgi:cysteine synthase A
MASLSSPSAAAAAAASGARFGPFPSRAQRLAPYPSLARGAHASTLVLRPQPHLDGRGHGLLSHTGSSSSSRCRAVAAEVEGLNIADNVTQVTHSLGRVPYRWFMVHSVVSLAYLLHSGSCLGVGITYVRTYTKSRQCNCEDLVFLLMALL